MKIQNVLNAITIAAIAVAAGHLSAQANVVENQNTYLYVDANVGSDANAGAFTTPLKTIQNAINKANTLNQQGIGVRVIVNPGIYREAVTIGNSKSTNATLTVQAAVAGTAIISGSNIVQGWSQQNATTWQAPFTDSTGFCPIPASWPSGYAPIIQRTEMVFVNGVPLTQVLAFNDVKPGTFYFSDAYQLIHIAPPAGTNMATATVEVASRPTTLKISGRSNIVIRGLVFRHAANCLNTSGASIGSSYNVLVDSVQALWNNWGGLGIYSSNYVTLQNSVASYNGGIGIVTNQDQNLLFNFNESDYNNWRGAQGAFYDWAMGGTKLFETHTATVQNHFSYNNQGEGLWFDTDNQNITVTNATVAGSVTAALQVERNKGPITVQNSHFCSSGQGINVLTTSNLTVKNSTLYNNSGTNKYQAEIYIAGTNGGIVINDFVTGQPSTLFTTGTVLSGNTFQDANGSQMVFGTYLSGTDWAQFATTLMASGNTWYNPATATAFKVPNGKIVNLAGWQSTVQNDYTSVWQVPSASPAAACAAPAPSYADFNLVTDNNTYTMSAAKALATARINSFGYATVALNVSGLPSGVSAALSQPSLDSGAVTVTFSAAPTAVKQKVPVTLWGVSGSRVHSVTIYLNVSPT